MRLIVRQRRTTDVDRGLVATIVSAGRDHDQTVVIRSARRGPHQAGQWINIDQPTLDHPTT
jgi:hypothetical protein